MLKTLLKARCIGSSVAGADCYGLQVLQVLKSVIGSRSPAADAAAASAGVAGVAAADVLAVGSARSAAV